MPRYFFNLYNDVDSTDEEGREWPDLDSARRAAVEDARHMAAESLRHGHLNLSHFVEVTVENRQVLFKVTFGEVVTITSDSDAEKTAD